MPFVAAMMDTKANEILIVGIRYRGTGRGRKCFRIFSAERQHRDNSASSWSSHWWDEHAIQATNPHRELKHQPGAMNLINAHTGPLQYRLVGSETLTRGGRDRL